jgi:hypothetical protein
MKSRWMSINYRRVMVMERSDIKLGARYIVLGFIMVLAYQIVQPEYANMVKDIGEIATSAIYGSVFGALTFVIKSHFDTKIEK